MRRLVWTGWVVVVALACAAPAASADVFAVLSHRASGRSDADVIRVDAGTGAISITPFDTPADEIHPSVSSDGSRIAFERINPKSGSLLSILVSDLKTGQTVEVVSEAEALARGDSSPGISADGRTLLTGGPYSTFRAGLSFPTVTLRSLAGFPSGPFGVSAFQTQYGFSRVGLVWDPVERGSLIAFDTAVGTTEGIVLGQLGGIAAPELSSAEAGYFKPAIGSPGGVPTVLFEVHKRGLAPFIASRPATLSSFQGPPTVIPGVNLINSLLPAFTPDNRYIGYLVRTNFSEARLFVWDTQTQTLINPTGVDVGEVAAGPVSSFELENENMSLYEGPPLILRAQITSVGSVNFNLSAESDVGILVQHVVGHHELFGRRVPTLKVVGHVPLGGFTKGHRHVRWNLRVNGRRLKPGNYQVTLRSLTASKKIRDLGVPDLIHVR